MEIYQEWAHCFVCGARCRVEDLDLPKDPVRTKKKDNIKEWMNYIGGLPLKRIRGLIMPYDSRGYYVVWPDKSYFKRRNSSGEPRYTAPTGIKPPLFKYPGSKKQLVVIEGELNARSVQESGDFTQTIISPGPASDFMRHIKVFLSYLDITLILDHDPAGIAFGVQVKDLLLKSGRHVKLVTVTKDYNEVLTESGPIVLNSRFKEDTK